MASIYERIVEAIGTDNGAEIGRRINVERQSVYRWRDNDTHPSRESLDKIIECSGVTLGWLLTGEGEKYPSKPAQSVELLSGLQREGLARSSAQPSPLPFHSLPVVAELVNHQLRTLTGETMVSIPQQIGSDNSVIITVQDDTWIAEGIHAGDLIVAEAPNGHNLNGRTVIALCNGRSIIRKFEQRGQLGYFASLLDGQPFSFPMDNVTLTYLVTAIVHSH